MRSAFLGMLVLIPFWAKAQVHITARVVDASTGEPLPYAFAAVQRSNAGTITNEDGYFRISIQRNGDSLRITYMGYKTRMLPLVRSLNGTEIQLERAPYELREAVVRYDDRPYQRVVDAARWLRRTPSTKTKLFYGMETHSDSTPVEIIHAFFNARFKGARMFDLRLKHGRIGLSLDNDRYFINYNTSRAFALLDITAEKSRFPTSPLKHTATKYLKRGFLVEEISKGNGPDGVDHLRATPRKNHTDAFTLELWLGSEDDMLRAFELHCDACPKHPFVPLFRGDRIHGMAMWYRQTWRSNAPAFPEITELSLDVEYIGPDLVDSFRTHAVMYAYDQGQPFIEPLFDYPDGLPDYRKMEWLPEDSLPCERISPPLPTERQQRDLAFLRSNDLRNGPWYEQLGTQGKILAQRYILWSPTERLRVKGSTDTPPAPIEPGVRVGFLGGHALVMKTPEVLLECQFYLDLDTCEGKVVHRSATVFDGFRSKTEELEYPWTACFENIWFDLCEMERRAMEERLSAPDLTLDQARSIHAEHGDRAWRTTRRYLLETYFGTKCEPLHKWNNRVKKALGIDNIALLGI